MAVSRRCGPTPQGASLLPAAGDGAVPRLLGSWAHCTWVRSGERAARSLALCAGWPLGCVSLWALPAWAHLPEALHLRSTAHHREKKNKHATHCRAWRYNSSTKLPCVLCSSVHGLSTVHRSLSPSERCGKSPKWRLRAVAAPAAAAAAARWQQRSTRPWGPARQGSISSCCGGACLRLMWSTRPSSPLARVRTELYARRATRIRERRSPLRRLAMHSRMRRTPGERYVRFVSCAIFTTRTSLPSKTLCLQPIDTASTTSTSCTSSWTRICIRLSAPRRRWRMTTANTSSTRYVHPHGNAASKVDVHDMDVLLPEVQLSRGSDVSASRGNE